MILLSSKAQDHLSLNECITAVFRHINADWGEVEASDRMMNDYNLGRKGMLFSQYRTEAELIYWVITYPGHVETLVLFPDEYGIDDVHARKGYVLHKTEPPSHAPC